MSTIKVSVEYEKPQTTKFEALVRELEVAKKVADETVDYYKPLADCAEEAKFEAIMEQLETIKWYAQQISSITHKATFISHQFGKNKFEVVYRPQCTTCAFEISYCGKRFSKDNFCNVNQEEINILGNWEEWHCFKNLENKAYQTLENLIEEATARGQKQINRLNNIQR